MNENDQNNLANASPNENNEAPVTNESEVTESNIEPEKKEEKLLSQDEVNRIVGKAKLDERNKLRREYEQFQKDAQQQQYNSQKSNQNISESSMRDYDENALREMITQQTERLAFERVISEKANEIEYKIEELKQQYPEKASAIEELSLDLGRNYSSFLLALNSVDNFGDVFADLADNPEKIVNLIQLANVSPTAFYKKLGSLSESIKVNNYSKNSPKSTPPLDQIKSSRNSINDGQMTLEDFRNADWLKV